MWKIIGYPLDHENHKVLLKCLVTTYHERRRKKKEDEIIKGILLDECKYGVNVLALYPDVHDVQDKGIQCDSHEVVKFFFQLDFKPMIVCVLVIHLKE